MLMKNMLYNNRFIELVYKANTNSEDFYKRTENSYNANPYYIGFGNPNANILFIGKEKGFDQFNTAQLRSESIDNVRQWKFLIDNEIFDKNYKFKNSLLNPEWEHFYNPLQPYHGQLNGKGQGQTWYYYNKLASLINNYIFEKEISQLCSNIFMTELNYQPSKYSPGKNNLEKEIKLRMDFIKNNDFYQNFNIVILAFGNYLDENQIKYIFGNQLNLISIENSISLNQRLLIFKDSINNRLIINTRQLSNQFPKKYLENIAKIIHSEQI